MRYYFARTKLSVVCVLGPKATNCIWGWRDREGFLFWKWIAITCKPTLKRHDSCLTASSSSGGLAPHIEASILYLDAGLYLIRYKAIHILICYIRIVYRKISSETKEESEDKNLLPGGGWRHGGAAERQLTAVWRGSVEAREGQRILRNPARTRRHNGGGGLLKDGVQWVVYF